MLQCVLQCVAVCCSVLQCIAAQSRSKPQSCHTHTYTGTWSCLPRRMCCSACSSVLQRVAACCSVLQYVAVLSRSIPQSCHTHIYTGTWSCSPHINTTSRPGWHTPSTLTQTPLPPSPPLLDCMLSPSFPSSTADTSELSEILRYGSKISSPNTEGQASIVKRPAQRNGSCQTNEWVRLHSGTDQKFPALIQMDKLRL